jgi:hypothetical protein
VPKEFVDANREAHTDDRLESLELWVNSLLPFNCNFINAINVSCAANPTPRLRRRRVPQWKR